MNDKIHEEIIRDSIKEKDLFKEDRDHKKFVHILAILIIFMVLTYFLLSIPSFNRFLGLISTEKSNSNIFRFNSNYIIFDENIISFLNENYEKQQKYEHVYCLNGRIENSNYVITMVFTPEIVSQAYNSVTFKPCPTETLIVLHTHPYKDCNPSIEDMKFLDYLKMRHGNALMAIMCEENRIGFYG